VVTGTLGKSEYSLQSQVNAKLAAGWHLEGGVTLIFAANDESDSRYAQAIAR
jgi:hypothetical protein